MDALAEMGRILGEPDPALRKFSDAVRDVVFEHYAEHITPMIAASWPELTTLPDARKLKFLACNLYATAPYTVLLCSPRHSGVARLLNAPLSLLSTHAIAALAGRAVKMAARMLSQETRRRIIVTGMFIATVDHVFDHCMNQVGPEERGRRIKGILDGTYTPQDGPLKLVRTLRVAMGHGVEDDAAFIQVIDRVRAWAESEVNGLSGVEDPTGLGWRMQGVLGTIDGLIFPVFRHAAPQARQWMYDVSLFVQIMDDWIDLDKDKRDGRNTPVITGRWTLTTVQEQFDKTLQGMQQLAIDAGFSSPRFSEFAREAYRLMAHEVMLAMVKGTAA